jgi:hypothetical protein
MHVDILFLFFLRLLLGPGFVALIWLCLCFALDAMRVWGVCSPIFALYFSYTYPSLYPFTKYMPAELYVYPSCITSI